MTREFHIVQQEPETDLSGIHPLLADSGVIIESAPAGPMDGGRKKVTFLEPLDGPQVIDVLTEPLSRRGIDFTDEDIVMGLKAMTYPNSRVMKNAKFVDPHARSLLRRQRPQIQGLINVIERSEHFEMVPANVHVLNPLLAEFAAWSIAGDMKPSEIKKLCNEHGIEYDETRVWRLKGGDRHNKPANIADMGLDTPKFVDAFVASRYRPKTAVPGAEPVLVAAEDLPADSWAHQPGYMELIKQVPEKAVNELGEYWQVLLRREDVPKHVVFPVVAWQTSAMQHTLKRLDMYAEYHRQRTTWMGVRKHFVHEVRQAVYNPANHTVEHTSTLLGAVMLARQIERSAVTEPLRLLQQGRHRSFWHRPPFDGRLAGQMIAVMQSPYVAARVMDGDSFKQVERLVQEDSPSVWT